MVDLFNLVAKITLDSSGYENQLNDAAKKTSTFGSKIKTGFKAVTGVVAAGVVAGTTAVIAITKQAIDAYKEYEQLAGGIQTLYGENSKAADEMMKHANEAWKTSGMSVNEYMETAIQSSAAMISSLKGDTDRAAELMDMSITDMSDNVNKMGTSMQSIQDAYRGFSRGNFTMLDNLALGYAGTKDGMQQLLDKAMEIEKQQGRNTKYSIDSYADIVQAIHVVQHEMGITGTTAAEASKTISGSIGAMKSAWKNLITGVADSNADLGKLIDNFIESIIGKGNKGGVLDNILPAVQRALNGVAKLITTAAPKIVPIIVKVILDNLPQLINAGTQVLVALITGIIQALPQLIAAIPQILAAIVGALQENWPALKEAGIKLLYMIGEGMLSALAWQLETVSKIVLAIKDYLVQKWTEVKEDTEELWKRMVNNVTDRIQKLKKKVIDTWAEIKASVINLVERIKQEVVSKWENLKQSVTDKIDALKQGLIEKWEAIKNSVTNAVENVKIAVVEKWENIKQTVTDTVENIKTAVTEKWANLRRDVERTVENLRTSVLATWDAIKSGIKRKVDDLIDPVVQKFWDFYYQVTGIIGWIQDFINGASLDLNVNARINRSVSTTYDDYTYETPPLVQEAQSGRDAAIQAAMQYNRAYAKAYDTPYLFETPTTVTFGDRLGAEFVYGRDNLMRDIREATGGGANVTINVYPQKGQSEKEIAREVQKEFVRWDKQRQVAFA